MSSIKTTKDLYSKLKACEWDANFINRDDHWVALSPCDFMNVRGAIDVKKKALGVQLNIWLDYYPSWFATLWGMIIGTETYYFFREEMILNFVDFNEMDVAFLDQAARSHVFEVDEHAVVKALAYEKQVMLSSQYAKFVALAYCGDVEALTEYINCLRRGERLGFFPQVTLEKLERALAYARSVDRPQDVMVLKDKRPMKLDSHVSEVIDRYAVVCEKLVKDVLYLRLRWFSFGGITLQALLDKLLRRPGSVDTQQAQLIADTIGFAISKIIVDQYEFFEWDGEQLEASPFTFLNRTNGKQYNLVAKMKDKVERGERISISEVINGIVNDNRYMH